MSYVWGMRGTCKATPLTEAIRGELYVQPYDSIDWNAARNQCAEQDLYYPHPLLQARNLNGATSQTWSGLSRLVSVMIAGFASF